MVRRGAWGSLPKQHEECRTWVAGGMEEAEEGEEAQQHQLRSSPHPAIAFEPPLAVAAPQQGPPDHVASSAVNADVLAGVDTSPIPVMPVVVERFPLFPPAKLLISLIHYCHHHCSASRRGRSWLSGGVSLFSLQSHKSKPGVAVFLQGDPTLPVSFQHVQVIEMFWDNCWLCRLNVIYQGKASAMGISVNRTV